MYRIWLFVIDLCAAAGQCSPMVAAAAAAAGRGHMEEQHMSDHSTYIRRCMCVYSRLYRSVSVPSAESTGIARAAPSWRPRMCGGGAGAKRRRDAGYHSTCTCNNTTIGTVLRGLIYVHHGHAGRIPDMYVRVHVTQYIVFHPCPLTRWAVDPGAHGTAESCLQLNHMHALTGRRISCGDSCEWRAIGLCNSNK